MARSLNFCRLSDNRSRHICKLHNFTFVTQDLFIPFEHIKTNEVDGGLLQKRITHSIVSECFRTINDINSYLYFDLYSSLTVFDHLNNDSALCSVKGDAFALDEERERDFFISKKQLNYSMPNRRYQFLNERILPASFLC